MGIEDYNEVSEGLRDNLTCSRTLEALNLAEMNYIREVLPRNWSELPPAERQEAITLIEDRLAELSDSGVGRALDSDPQVKAELAPVLHEIPIEKLEAPQDFVQVEQISDRLNACKELEYGNWRTLSLEDKVQVLNALECDIARIEHRPPVPVYAQQLGPDLFGGYNREDKTITINSDYIEMSSYDSDLFKEILDTLVHEGRHAYQDYNMNVCEVHPRQSEISSWRENEEDGYCGGDASELGARLYRFQPLEIDARQFAQDVISKLNTKIIA